MRVAVLFQGDFFPWRLNIVVAAGGAGNFVYWFAGIAACATLESAAADGAVCPRKESCAPESYDEHAGKE